MVAKGEHREGDGGAGGVEPVGGACECQHLGLGGLDDSLGEAVVEGCVDRGTVFGASPRQFDGHPDDDTRERRPGLPVAGDPQGHLRDARTAKEADREIDYIGDSHLALELSLSSPPP